ncbi:hypothetical protein KCP75_19975 [Salmonella enterica subsp. enterica]|nr:hypothetical protein KCP75_19975 [Salmonella enterica subsp. enterica]
MLERIRDIPRFQRTSSGLFAGTRDLAPAADYQPSLKETTQFFKPSRTSCAFACTDIPLPNSFISVLDASQPHMGADQL